MVNQRKQNYGEERRFIDDMSDIDIELQKQTKDVSTDEIMQEVDNIQAVLRKERDDTQENKTRGE